MNRPKHTREFFSTFSLINISRPLDIEEPMAEGQLKIFENYNIINYVPSSVRRPEVP